MIEGSIEGLGRRHRDTGARFGPGSVAVRPQALGKIMFRRRRRSLVRWRVSRKAGAAAQARKGVRTTLARWGWEEDRTATALLVASEMVTNARVHTTGEVRMTLRRTRRGVRVTVFDTAAALPVRRSTGPARAGGFGLHILDTCTARWGVRRRRGGKIVWADIDASASRTARGPRRAPWAPRVSHMAATMWTVASSRPGLRPAARLRYVSSRARALRRGLPRRHTGMLWGAVSIAG